jgi:peptide/nickel transport system substrate-binding protein
MEERPMSDAQRLNELVEQVKTGSISRRSFMAAAVGLGLSMGLARSLFAVNSAAAAPAGTATRQVSAFQGEPTPGGQVIVGHSQEPTLFNPMLSTLEVDRGVQYSLFDSLWRIDENAAFVPNLATEIPTVENGGISEDGLTYTIKVRQDAKFHDGEALTAADVLFTHQTIMRDDITTPLKLGHDQVTSAELVDEYTLKLTLGQAFAPFLIVLSDTYIVPEHILSGVTDMLTTEFNSTAPVGSGPFKFSNRTPGESITVVKNEAYHGPGPYLDQIIFKYVPDLESLFTQFKTGEVDVTGIQGITADNYEEAQSLEPEGKTVLLSATAFVEFIYFNLGMEIFQDQKVREALYYAMDKTNIIDAVYYGVHSPSETYLAESSWALNPNLPAHEYNPDRAKQLLDEAGWTEGGDGIREKNGVKLSFTNSTTAGNAVREQAQQYLQQTWRDVGVDMQINNMPAAVIWGDYYNKSEYQTVMIGEISGIGGDPDATARFASDQVPIKDGRGKNTIQYSNPEMDDLLRQGATEPDQEKRKEIYFRVQEILRTELPVLPIFHYNFIEGTKSTLRNYKPNAFVVSNNWNTADWWLEE